MGNTPSGPEDRALKGNITADSTFRYFDENGDGRMVEEEFRNLMEDLFRDASGKPHTIDPGNRREMYFIFENRDLAGLTRKDFQHTWDCWIKTILRPVSAIIVIDVQNDFIDGSLAIKEYDAKQDGADVVPVVNNILDTVPFDNIFYSQDWHPKNHISFFESLNQPDRELADDSPIKKKSEAKLFSKVVFKGPPKINQTLWPRHCEQGSEGARFHKDLKIHPLSVNIQKGTDPKIDSESAFWDNGKLAQTQLDKKLKERGVTDLYTCGIATDVCVKATSKDAQDLGYRTILIQDASGGIFNDGILKTKEEVRARKGVVVNSADVKDLVQGRNRPAELGYFKALRCKK